MESGVTFPLATRSRSRAWAARFMRHSVFWETRRTFIGNAPPVRQSDRVPVILAPTGQSRD